MNFLKPQSFPWTKRYALWLSARSEDTRKSHAGQHEYVVLKSNIEDVTAVAGRSLCFTADSPMALVSSPLALRMENLNLARTSAFGQLTSSR